MNSASAERLRNIIGDSQSAVVALSGGVDSSLVAQICFDVLCKKALAVTGVSASLSTAEKQDIENFVSKIGIAHRFVDTHELQQPEYRRNNPDRCFHCKSELYGTLRRIADEGGYADVFDGTHLDDHDGHRPSLKAAENAQVRSPLAEANLRKPAVREIASAMGLDNAERPSAPCLSSRIAYGLEVNEERLEQVARAEAALRDLGFQKFRVRHHDKIARIEFSTAELDDAFGQRKQVSEAVKNAGFTIATIDLDGYRSGSLLELLPSDAS